MLESLIDFDKKLLLLINSWHNPWMDKAMMLMTNGLYWLPLFLVVISVIIYKYRWDSVTLFILLAIVIFLTDQISASVIKPLVGRLRPTHDPELENLVHIVNNYRGGLYSFVSSHATNSFGAVTFLFLAVRRRIKWIWVLFIWAAFFSYTRLYLGVHYPLDIICGALLGIVLGYLVYWAGSKLPKKFRLKS